jgi:hypothetical protein
MTVILSIANISAMVTMSHMRQRETSLDRRICPVHGDHRELRGH